MATQPTILSVAVLTSESPIVMVRVLGLSSFILLCMIIYVLLEQIPTSIIVSCIKVLISSDVGRFL